MGRDMIQSISVRGFKLERSSWQRTTTQATIFFGVKKDIEVSGHKSISGRIKLPNSARYRFKSPNGALS